MKNKQYFYAGFAKGEEGIKYYFNGIYMSKGEPANEVWETILDTQARGLDFYVTLTAFNVV